MSIFASHEMKLELARRKLAKKYGEDVLKRAESASANIVETLNEMISADPIAGRCTLEILQYGLKLSNGRL